MVKLNYDVIFSELIFINKLHFYTFITDLYLFILGGITVSQVSAKVISNKIFAISSLINV
jgi:hypothetical protein